MKNYIFFFYQTCCVLVSNLTLNSHDTRIKYDKAQQNRQEDVKTFSQLFIKQCIIYLDFQQAWRRST